MTWILSGGGILALLFGTLAYTRHWRNWIGPVAPGQYGYSVGFGFVFFGAAALAVGAANAMLEAGLTVAAYITGALGACSMLVFVVSLFWLPRALLPGWFKTAKGI